MRFGSLFAGIGGFDLGLERAGMQCSWQVEIDPYCQRVLAKHWTDVRRHGDIREVHGIATHSESGEDRRLQQSKLSTNTRAGCEQSNDCPSCLTPVDLICGGFPCQPFSVAGKRRGKTDDRYLWPEMLRVIQEVRPRWVLGENVTGIIHMELDTVLSDLEAEGYETQTFIIPACGVDAKHRRDRVWIVAHTTRGGEEPRAEWRASDEPSEAGIVANTVRTFSQGLWSTKRISEERSSTGSASRWLPEPELGRVAHGIPSRVDRLRALGNAVVPQVVEVIGRAIMECEHAETC